MNILYIAYSCSPYHGSEDKIGWNIPLQSAQTNRVIVLTKEEQRKDIEDYMRSCPVSNPSFFYVDIPDVYKRLFRGPLYSGRLNIWQKRALKTAREICAKENIDIIHQITPVEFRSIGKYGKIPGVKFVCGPIAGGQSIPRELISYAGSHRIVEVIRELVNAWYRFALGRSGRLKNCGYLLLANRETEAYLRSMLPEKERYAIRTDVSVDRRDLTGRDFGKRPEGRPCRFLVVGRLIYLKGQELLLDALARIPKELSFECHIVGEGAQRESLRKKCAEKGLEHCVTFRGAVPYTQIGEVYADADVLVMPSFREATGSVLLEAMAKGLPVVTINRFGGADILDDDTGWLYDGDSREAYIENLKSALMNCILRPEEVRRRGENAGKRAQMYTWDEKMRLCQSIYEQVLAED